MFENPWTNELVVQLRARWAEGLSASIIANELSTEAYSFTRNAVCGKLSRLGLQRDDSIVRKIVARIPARDAQRARRLQSRTVSLARPAAVPRPRAAPPPVIPDVARVSLVELTRAHCRWPVGEPLDAGFGFCGETVTRDHTSYCEHHRHRSLRRYSRDMETEPVLV